MVAPWPSLPTAPFADPQSLSEDAVRSFQRTVLAHYHAHGRDLPWRDTRDPYRILVSEVMLQQTQVPRVLAAYEAFLERFPDVFALAAAAPAAVLAAWQGLGYNRRALALQRCARIVVDQRGGELPRTPVELRALPGIGPATAAAVLAFAFGVAEPFIETNIRAVYLHAFFPDRDDVPDRDILPLVEATLERGDPRTWYYALMDYGVHLKKSVPNPSRRSRHHVRQSPCEGSRRQLRAVILRIFLNEVGSSDTSSAAAHPSATGPGLRRQSEGAPRGAVVWRKPSQVAALLAAWPEEEVEAVLAQLAVEGFLQARDDSYGLA